MDDFKYSHAPAMPDLPSVEKAPDPVPPAADQPAANPAVAKFNTCRWKATPEQGDFCTHRDVLPFAGKEGFKPDSWCPECAFYKLRRTPKKRERIDYSY